MMIGIKLSTWQSETLINIFVNSIFLWVIVIFDNISLFLPIRKQFRFYTIYLMKLINFQFSGENQTYFFASFDIDVANSFPFC